ncbi:MAG: MliC family protein [Halioglobus sp.]
MRQPNSGASSSRHLVPAFLMAIALGCSNFNPQGEYVDARFDCTDGETLQVRFYQEQERAVLNRDGAKVTLAQQRTASGFHYANADTAIRGKGNELRLETVSEAPVICTAS